MGNSASIAHPLLWNFQNNSFLRGSGCWLQSKKKILNIYCILDIDIYQNMLTWIFSFVRCSIFQTLTLYHVSIWLFFNECMGKCVLFFTLRSVWFKKEGMNWKLHHEPSSSALPSFRFHTFDLVVCIYKHS